MKNIKTLVPAINAITKHLLLAKCQANFLRAKKESLKVNEMIVLGDFAENYQFLVQDEIQSYPWSKEYYTLHPLIVYFINDDRNIQHNPLITITTTIQILFLKCKQSLLITFKKTFHLWIRSSFFRQLCSTKNRKTFINLCRHQQDFNMDAEWIFFATSNGKSPCDGVGKFVKRYFAKCSLQIPLHDQILSYQSMSDLYVRVYMPDHKSGRNGQCSC